MMATMIIGTSYEKVGGTANKLQSQLAHPTFDFFAFPDFMDSISKKRKKLPAIKIK